MKNFWYRLSALTGCVMAVLIAFDVQGKTASNGIETANSWKRFSEQQISVSPAFKFKYESCFKEAARRSNLPVTVLLAVARGESDFKPRAISKANAIGVMQILWPATARELGVYRKSELFNPCTNIDAGARYLRTLMDRYQGDYHLALAAYNYGPGRIRVGSSPVAIPKGAQWYSAYILDHLQYVLGDGAGRKGRNLSRALPDYSKLGKYPVIVFNQPFRAKAFREYLQNQLTGIHFDWFNKGLGRYEVTMTYQGSKEFQRNLRKLRSLGLNL